MAGHRGRRCRDGLLTSAAVGYVDYLLSDLPRMVASTTARVERETAARFVGRGAFFGDRRR